jgi:hypothetical protein
MIGVLVEREAEARDGRLLRMLARSNRIETPEPVEIGLESAGAGAIPPELRDGRARVVAREDAEQLTFGLAFGVDAERDARVVADVVQRNLRIGDLRLTFFIPGPGRCRGSDRDQRNQRRDDEATHVPPPPVPLPGTALWYLEGNAEMHETRTSGARIGRRLV